MHIAYIHQYFKTPEEGGSIRSYHLARGLIANGHQVSMITAHNQLRGVREVDGIQVHYLPVPYANHFGFFRRIWAFWRFVKLAKRELSILPKFELAYVMTTPLTTGLIGIHAKEKYNVPFYFEVGDLWPEAPIKMGAIRNVWLKRWLYRFERRCYFEAHKVIALSPAIRNYIESAVPQTKVYVVPNFSDNAYYKPTHKIGQFRTDNPFRIGYFGTFGRANQLDFLLIAAHAAQAANLPVEFTLMGEGALFQSIKSQARGLGNVTVLPHAGVRQVRKLMKEQDAVYVSFKNLEILNTGSPNKFFDGLAAGKLIIINFGGWISNLLDHHKCGFSYDPLHPDEFVRKLAVFVKQPELLATYQKRARNLGEMYYDKDLQIQKLLKILGNDQRVPLSDSEVYILTA